MELSLQDIGLKIIEECKSLSSKNPIEIFKRIAKQDFIMILIKMKTDFLQKQLLVSGHFLLKFLMLIRLIILLRI